MIKKFYPLILSIIFTACAAKLPYATDYPMTRQIFHSRDGVLAGSIPSGWFTPLDDTLSPAIVGWLIKDDFSASITIMELKLDNNTENRVRKEGIELLARISIGLLEDNYRAQDFQYQIFELKGKEYCSYEFSNGFGRRRMAVFSSAGKYYQCESRPVRGEWTGTDLAKLFTVQQTFLFSLSP